MNILLQFMFCVMLMLLPTKLQRKHTNMSILLQFMFCVMLILLPTKLQTKKCTTSFYYLTK